MAEVSPGIDWPMVLSRKDELAGRGLKTYKASDVQTQLRVHLNQRRWILKLELHIRSAAERAYKRFHAKALFLRRGISESLLQSQQEHATSLFVGPEQGP